MWKVKIEGIPGLDGEYEIALEKYKHRHWRTLNRMADTTPTELAGKLIRGDTTVVLALAAIELERAGKPFIEEMLWDSGGEDGGEIRLIEEPDASPPSVTPSGSGESENEDEKKQPSGEPTSNGLDLSPEPSTQQISGAPV
jgi:hypothetical protein